MWKSWATDPAIQMANEGQVDMYMAETRTAMSKNLSYYLINGMDKEAQRVLLQVMGSFTKQYGDSPGRAQDEYGTWLKRQTKAIGKHPRLRTWNQKEIMDKLSEASNFSARERNKAREQMIEFLKGQVTVDRIKRIQALNAKSTDTRAPAERFEARQNKLSNMYSILP